MTIKFEIEWSEKHGTEEFLDSLPPVGIKTAFEEYQNGETEGEIDHSNEDGDALGYWRVETS